MAGLRYEWGRRRSQLYDPPPPPTKFTRGIARCPSPQPTATFKYPRIPWVPKKGCARRRTPRPPGWVRHDRIDLSNSGDERQREFDRVHKEIDRSARYCEAWFSHPWLTEGWNWKETCYLGWRRFERPYKMGYVTAVLEEGRSDVLGDRLVTVLPGAVRSGRVKNVVVEIESESGSESEDGG